MPLKDKKTISVSKEVIRLGIIDFATLFFSLAVYSYHDFRRR